MFLWYLFVSLSGASADGRKKLHLTLLPVCIFGTNSCWMSSLLPHRLLFEEARSDTGCSLGLTPSRFEENLTRKVLKKAVKWLFKTNYYNGAPSWFFLTFLNSGSKATTATLLKLVGCELSVWSHTSNSASRSRSLSRETHKRWHLISAELQTLEQKPVYLSYDNKWIVIMITEREC